MKIADVKELDVLDRFLYFINERHMIRLRKNLNKPKPWTEDEILQRYKFCNVRRIHDRTSQWLLHNWFEPYKDHPNMLAACTVARQLNNTESLAEIGFPEKWDPSRICTVLGKRTDRGLTNYSSAYMVMGSLDASRPKIEQSVWLIADKVRKTCKIDTYSMEAMWGRLCDYDGLGSFMAGQIVADLRWGMSGAWEDKMTWAPAGPGSIRGANRLYDRPLDKKVTQEQFLQEIRKLFTALQDDLPGMEMMDFQNCHCEFDKYERTLHGEGRPKQLYPGMPPVETLHKKQIDILKTLAGSAVPLTRKQISSLSGVDGSKIGDYAGPRPTTQSEKTKLKWPFPSLIDLGYVKFDIYDVNGRDVQLYCLSETGATVSKSL